jgi:predicted phage tail protein
MGAGPLTGAGNWWSYRSTDAATTVDDTDYFTNGSALGMKVGDVVVVCDTDTSTTMTLHRVTAVTAGGAATISGTGLTIT